MAYSIPEKLRKFFARQVNGNVIFTASVSTTLAVVLQKQAVYNASKAAVV